jgi:hypothetical protein
MKKFYDKLCLAGLAGLVSVPAFAAIDLPTIKTSVEASQGAAETVGGYVIVAVVALLVVGLIISVVRKV